MKRSNIQHYLITTLFFPLSLLLSFLLFFPLSIKLTLSTLVNLSPTKKRPGSTFTFTFYFTLFHSFTISTLSRFHLFIYFSFFISPQFIENLNILSIKITTCYIFQLILHSNEKNMNSSKSQISPYHQLLLFFFLFFYKFCEFFQEIFHLF